MRLRRFRRDALESLQRWPCWWPEFKYYGLDLYRLGLGWECTWTGPMGGHHVNYGLTCRGAHRAALREIASWTRQQQTRREWPIA